MSSEEIGIRDQKISPVNPLVTGENNVMEFLNEIRFQYPNAISLASGNPDDNYLELQNYSEYIEYFVESKAQSLGKSREEIFKILGQYNKAKGIISDHLVNYLKKDERIDCFEEDLVLTVGVQEAIAISVITLCDRDKDVIIIEDPTYIGITDFSVFAGYQIETVPTTSEGISLDILESKILELREEGKNVKLVYTIPNFQNPTGNSMSADNGRRLLDLAQRYSFYIVEDNAYNDFSFEGKRPTSLKSIDINARVIYLHSFSKSLNPSLRLGILVANQVLEIGGVKVRLSDFMAKTKAYISLNTPSLSQAYLGGVLLKNDYSLENLNAEKIDSVKKKRDQMLRALETYMSGPDKPYKNGIKWNTPKGGFFLTLSTPFNITKEDITICAEKFNVIFTPMSFFYYAQGGEKQIRLSYSHISLDKINQAIENLSKFFNYKNTCQ